MFYLLLDILIYNFTPYLSYFFLLNLNNKSYIYNLSVALLIEFLILHTYFYVTIFVTIIYFIKKYFLKFNYHNFYIYFLYNISLILIFYLVSSLIFSYISLSNLINVLVINSIFIVIGYKKDVLNINLC